MKEIAKSKQMKLAKQFFTRTGALCHCLSNCSYSCSFQHPSRFTYTTALQSNIKTQPRHFCLLPLLGMLSLDNKCPSSPFKRKQFISQALETSKNASRGRSAGEVSFVFCVSWSPLEGTNGLGGGRIPIPRTVSDGFGWSLSLGSSWPYANTEAAAEFTGVVPSTSIGFREEVGTRFACASFVSLHIWTTSDLRKRHCVVCSLKS
jgi:hypothetical protein